MTKRIQISPRRVFNSGASGAWMIIPMPDALLGLIGGSTTALIEFTVYAVSGGNARLKAQVWQGTKADARPSGPSGGVQIGSDTSLGSPGVTNVTLTPPYHALVDVLFGGASTDAGVTWVEAEIHTTLSFE